jgi:hypothetical protein
MGKVGRLEFTTSTATDAMTTKKVSNQSRRRIGITCP